MWYGPSRLLWNAMRFPSGLHAGRRFEAVVFVSCRIGDAASLTYAVTSARNAARYRARSTTSLLPVISSLGRARRAKYPKRLLAHATANNAKGAPPRKRPARPGRPSLI